MNKTNIALVLAIVAIVIACGGYMYPTAVPVAQKAGGLTNYDSIALSIPSVGTSSITRAGCVGVFATSTATPIIFTFSTSGTSTVTGTSPSNGSVAWNYGTCPSPAGL